MIEVKGLSKKYKIMQRERYLALRDILANSFKKPFEFFRRQKANVPSNVDFWALKDISFGVKQGEVIGIIGRNGAGKTTLLKVLSRITEPTEGEVILRGRVVSLLEVGTGFHPELTGRENVYFNGSIMGMKKREINRRFDDIVAFSGVEKFLDTPVKRFSSGMKVRLAFSVAAHLEPEILLVDEVLAVGDAQFQKKCLGKMKDVSQSGRTVLFVSHNMSAIHSLCKRTIMLDCGKIVLDGDTNTVVAKYLDQNLTTGAIVSREELERKMEGQINRSNPCIRPQEIKLVNEDGQVTSTFSSNGRINVSITYKCFTDVTGLILSLYIVDEESRVILATQNIDCAEEANFYERAPGIYRSLCSILPNLFGHNRYYISLHLQIPKVEHIVLDRIIGFDVIFQGYEGIQYGSVHNTLIRPFFPWKTNPIGNMTEEING